MNRKVGWVLLFTAIFLDLSLAGDYSSWAKYRNIALSTSGITTAGVAKIPVLIRFTETNQSDMFTGSTAALANGADIRVTKSDGTTDLPFEMDSWTSGTGGSGAIWVLMDSVPGNNAAAYSLRVYWNKAGAATMSSPATTFSSSNGFLAVWHFNEASGSPALNATGNGNQATPGGGSAAPANNTASIIGTGKNFSASSSQYYQVGTDSSALNLNSNTGPYIITAWVNPTSCSSRIAAISKYANDNSSGTRQYALHTANTATDWRMTDDPAALSNTTANNEYVADVVGGCVEGSWTYLAGGYNSNNVAPTADAAGAANVFLSVNGATAVTGIPASQATGTSIGTGGSTFIGKIGSNERYMDGAIDEMTVSNVVRPADWIKLSYETQKPGATAIFVSTTTTNLPGAPSITSNPANRSATVGTTAKFGVVATGTGSLIYKWVRRNTDTVGTNSDTLTLSNVSNADTGSYKCVVQNSVSMAVSNSAALTVTPVALLSHAPSLSSFNARVSGSAVVFDLPKGLSNIQISVMDLKGREVWNQRVNTGSREVSWDAKTPSGALAAAGVYSAQLFSEGLKLAEARVIISR